MVQLGIWNSNEKDFQQWWHNLYLYIYTNCNTHNDLVAYRDSLVAIFNGRVLTGAESYKSEIYEFETDADATLFLLKWG